MVTFEYDHYGSSTSAPHQWLTHFTVHYMLVEGAVGLVDVNFSKDEC